VRRLIVIVGILIALVVGGLATVPRLLVWDDYRDELTAKAEAMTGRSVAIRGHIDLNLLPQPTLSLARTTLSSQPDAVDRMRLEVDRLDLELNPLPLLGGRLDVEEVRLVRPVLQVEPAASDRPELPQLVGAVAWLPLAPDGPSRVTVIDGRAVLPDGVLGQAGRIDDVNLALSTSDLSGAIALDGAFALNRQPFRLDARLGRPTPDSSSTLRLTLAADDAGASGSDTLTFGGVVWWGEEAPRLRGELVFEGGDARSALGRLSEALGHHIVPMPSWLAAPFRLAGPVELGGDRLRFPDLALDLDGAALTGHWSLVLAPRPEIDLALDAARIAVPAEAPLTAPYDELAPLVALVASLRGRIDLSIGALDYRGDTVRRFRAALELPGDGAAGVEEVRAILPGQTDVSFAGRLAAASEPKLQGSFTAVTENLRALLAWLDLSPDDVPEGRLSSLSLASQVSIAPDIWRFDDVELRVDAARAIGQVALAPAPRPAIEATFEVDRLDLDAYWPGQAPTDLLQHLARPFQLADAAIEARLARLSWRGVQLLDLDLAGRVADGQLTIERLAVGDLAEATAGLAGEVDLANGAYDLSAELRGVQAARLLRRLGLQPPSLLTRLKPLAVDGAARGSPEAAQVELEVGDGAGVVALRGEIGFAARPRYDLEVGAAHPDYQALLRDLGAGPFAPTPAQPLTVTGTLEHDDGESLIAGTARLGQTSFTGRLAWQDQGARPTMSARISIGEPTAPVLAGLLDLTGLQLEWPALEGSLQGQWSERPLAVHLLDRFDGELTLSSKGGLAGPGFELVARFEEGRLVLDRLAMALWGGDLEGQLELDVRRPLPYLTGSIDLGSFEPTALAAWLGVPPLVTGAADLHLEGTGAGNSVRAMVGSLIGEVELALDEAAVLEALPESFTGRKAPLAATPGETVAPLADLSASFPLERGVVTLPPTELRVDGVGVEIEGQIDLYLWATDLSLRPSAGGPELRVVGPLDRPQVRLNQPPAPNASAPAPAIPRSVE
jgi:AsmA family/AsmA-like C-terminal region